MSINKCVQTCGVHCIDIANKAKVDTSLYRTSVRAYNVHIGTCKAYGVNTYRLQLCHDVLVHQSTINHCYNFKHIGIRNASSANHLALYA